MSVANSHLHKKCVSANNTGNSLFKKRKRSLVVEYTFEQNFGRKGQYTQSELRTIENSKYLYVVPGSEEFKSYLKDTVNRLIANDTID